jgi:SAM-dependent methyltransferase
MNSAFVTLYSGLMREGPGEAADVAWASGMLDLPGDAAICDAGCGTGGDIDALLDAAPEGTVTAIDREGAFIRALRQDWAADNRVWAETGDMAALDGEYDLIWSAGAVYFLGVTPALTAWRTALKDGGAVAFSHPCFFTEAPSAAARDFWNGYMPTDASGIVAEVLAAGYETLATRRVSDAGWDIFYQGLSARAAQLRPTADAEMLAVVQACEAEIASWQVCRAETGYLLSVVRPR